MLKMRSWVAGYLSFRWKHYYIEKSLILLKFINSCLRWSKATIKSFAALPLTEPTGSHLTISGYERLERANEQITNGNVNPADTNEEDADFPLLEESLKYRESETKNISKLAGFSIRPSTVFFLCFSVFIISLLFYTICYYFAATDASCQRRMWAFSKRGSHLPAMAKSNWQYKAPKQIFWNMNGDNTTQI